MSSDNNSLGINWYSGDLILEAAPPATGKTLFDIQACFSAIEHRISPIVFFTLKCSQWHISNVMLRHQLGNAPNSEGVPSLGQLPEVPIIVEELPCAPIDGLITRILYYVKERGVKMVVVDCLQDIETSIFGMYWSSENRMKKCLEYLKTLAKTCDIILLVTSQMSLNHTFENVPTSRDILDVPFAEEICDQVLLHYTPDWLEKPNLRKIIVVQGDHYYERDITIDVEYDQETVSLKFLSSDEEDDLP